MSAEDIGRAVSREHYECEPSQRSLAALVNRKVADLRQRIAELEAERDKARHAATVAEYEADLDAGRIAELEHDVEAMRIESMGLLGLKHRCQDLEREKAELLTAQMEAERQAGLNKPLLKRIDQLKATLRAYREGERVYVIDDAYVRVPKGEE